MGDYYSRICGNLQIEGLCKAQQEIAQLQSQLAAANAERERLNNEITDAKAFAFNMLIPRTVEDQKDTLDERLQLVYEMVKRLREGLRKIQENINTDPNIFFSSNIANCELKDSFVEGFRFANKQAAAIAGAYFGGK